MLAPKQPEHPFADDIRSLAHGNHQLQPEKILMVEFRLSINRGQVLAHCPGQLASSSCH